MIVHTINVRRIVKTMHAEVIVIKNVVNAKNAVLHGMYAFVKLVMHGINVVFVFQRIKLLIMYRVRAQIHVIYPVKNGTAIMNAIDRVVKIIMIYRQRFAQKHVITDAFVVQTKGYGLMERLVYQAWCARQGISYLRWIQLVKLLKSRMNRFRAFVFWLDLSGTKFI